MDRWLNKILLGNAPDVLRELPDNSIHCCVTSPPYWRLRDYGVEGQLGLEKTPEEYVQKMVEVFREVRRVLRDDGILFLNLGDSYYGSGNCTTKQGKSQLKPKDLVGIPWRVAFALQDDGWYLRQDIIWHKRNAMPESVKDRPTKAHEYIFLMSKSGRYYYDAESIKEKSVSGDPRRPYAPGQVDNRGNGHDRGGGSVRVPAGWKTGSGSHGTIHSEGRSREVVYVDGFTNRNKRSVWTIPTHAYSEAHFATFPPDLIKPCILAGCPENGITLDPFMGAGTTGVVCADLGRNYIGIELNPEYVRIANERIKQATRQERLFL
jgi:DNA modification methylase